MFLAQISNMFFKHWARNSQQTKLRQHKKNIDEYVYILRLGNGKENVTIWLMVILEEF